MGQFAHHQVNADCVTGLQRQNDAEDRQRARGCLCLSHGIVLQAFRLVAPGVRPGHAVVGLGQDCLNLLILVACQDSAEKVVSVYGGSKDA